MASVDYVFERAPADKSGSNGEAECPIEGDPATKASISKCDLAKHVYEMRRLRTKFLPSELFGEPCWDILLLLYWAEGRRQWMSVTAVCVSSGVPMTTALRWVEKLLDTDLLEKQAHPRDRRVTWLRLSNRAKAAIDDYIELMI